jgi:hypothetical protein
VQIFQWRVLDRLGANTIANRLNNDPAIYDNVGTALLRSRGVGSVS